jgi:hypothetical protein
LKTASAAGCGCCAKAIGTPNIVGIADNTMHAVRQIDDARIEFPPAAFSYCGT